MKHVIVFTTLFTGVLTLCISCSSPSDRTSTTIPVAQARIAMYNQPASDEENYQIRAQFIDFEMGDVSHYLFEDEHGEIWDFIQIGNLNEFEFKQALPAELHNDFNRGWKGNEALQGKWFLLKCSRNHQPLYQGGPESEVAIVTQASLLY